MNRKLLGYNEQIRGGVDLGNKLVVVGVIPHHHYIDILMKCADETKVLEMLAEMGHTPEDYTFVSSESTEEHSAELYYYKNTS
jgi:hypothetical protein